MSTDDLWEIKIEPEKTKVDEQVDYKMVSFSLGGKDYGIDILKVKEILEINKFTYVPNTAPYVRGVHNLRGDIISIIDLRIMFGVPKAKRENNMEDIIVLLIDDKRIGVIVDSINKVVSVLPSSIKPPHPIFSNISIKYISGIVDNNSRIYIILDVEKIFGTEQEEKNQKAGNFSDIDQKTIAVSVTTAKPDFSAAVSVTTAKPDSSVAVSAPAAKLDSSLTAITDVSAAEIKKENDQNKEFIKETLKTFINFHITDLNKDWFDSNFQQWVSLRKDSEKNIQLEGSDDAKMFVKSYYSPCTSMFFDANYARAFSSILPTNVKGNYFFWNVGCGCGYETYSVTALLRTINPSAAIKVWGSEKDLLSISTAPNLIVDSESVPDYLKSYTTKGTKGDVMSQILRNIIFFEYHDIKNSNMYSDLDLIVCRDVLPFFDYNEQTIILNKFYDKLKKNGILILGDNEKVKFDGLTEFIEQGICFYKKI